MIPVKTYIGLGLSAFLWGASAIAGKYALEVYTPSVVTFLRFFIASLVMFFLAWHQQKQIHLDFTGHLRLFIISMVGVSLCYYFYFKGLNKSTAFNAGIIEATIPILTLLLAGLLRMEKIRSYQMTGVFIAYSGVMITISNGDWRIMFESEYSCGDIFLLLSTVCFGIYNILVRVWQTVIPKKIFIFWFFFYGWLALIPWMLTEQTTYIPPEPDMYPQALAAVAFMSLGGSVIAYLLFNRGIAEIGVSRAASFINLVPLVTIFLSIFVLNESVGFFQWGGAIVILAGVCITNLSAPHQ